MAQAAIRSTTKLIRGISAHRVHRQQ